MIAINLRKTGRQGNSLTLLVSVEPFTVQILPAVECKMPQAVRIHKLRHLDLNMARLGGLFGPLALTPSGSPSLRSRVPQPALQVSVEPLTVQILPAVECKMPQAVRIHKLRHLDLNMARLGGFEPPTARFVAEYSIQLSYSRQ